MNALSHHHSITVVIIDDDDDIRINTADLLSTEFSNIETYSSVGQAIKQIKPDAPMVILSDLRMPDGDGFEFAQQALAIDNDIPIILMTAYGDISLAVDTIKQGIYDFIEKPFNTDRLLKVVSRAAEKRFLTLSLRQAKQHSHHSDNINQRILGYSAAIEKIRSAILDFAAVNIPLMIYGETGTGKELVAHCLHHYSPERSGPLVALNCAAIPESLAEAELFGYRKGAFTDAKQNRTGKLEHANNGTLFLDEVESLPLATQAKLLRALSDETITPVGSNEEIPINCRLVSATKTVLKDNPNFRQDLFFRLQVAELHLPPLRDRGDDIIHLFESFCAQSCKQLKTQYKPIKPYTKQQLMAYQWPGNIRELINIATRHAMRHCSDIDYALHNQSSSNAPAAASHSLKDQVENYEAMLIKEYLVKHKGKVAPVLEALTIERITFNQKLKKYGINTSDFKC
ncbi:MAG: sigma-54 dependent transcriptional regulator [Pseudomonadota bacterium]